MGASSAWELVRAGARVTVLEKSIPGAEASSAAAGILGAEAEAHEPGPMVDLCRYSRSLYPRWVRDLEKETSVSHFTGVIGAGFFVWLTAATAEVHHHR